MKKTILIILALMLLATIAGFGIVRNALVSVLNLRMDSSEAVITNEISGRLYRDFNMNIQPQNVNYTKESFEYTNGEGDTVQLSNSDQFIQIKINREDGTNWVGKAKGNIEVSEIRYVEIPKENIKVDLLSTNSKLYAITFRIIEDPRAYLDVNNREDNLIDRRQTKRVSLNREYTVYYSIVGED